MAEGGRKERNDAMDPSSMKTDSEKLSSAHVSHRMRDFSSVFIFPCVIVL